MGSANRRATRLRSTTALLTAVAVIVTPLFLPEPALAGTQGTVTGSIFGDTNGNGTFDGGEPGISGRTVFADYDDDGTIDPGEPSVTTSGFGTYSLTGVDQGLVHVATQLPPDWIRTTTSMTTDVVADDTVTGVDIGTFRLGTISGTVYEDANGNGVKNTGEVGVAGMSVFFDSNANSIRDGGEPSTTTDSSGGYRFANLSAGGNLVRVTVPDGVVQTNADPPTVDVISGTSAVLDFGLYAPGTLGGSVYRDLDGDGTRDVGEPGHGGVTVFLDDNTNGIRDGGEVAVSTDGSGRYGFTNLGARTFSIAVVAPPSYSSTSANPITRTVTSGSVDDTADFGMSDTGVLSGRVFEDSDNNGVVDAGEVGSSGRTLFIDTDNDGILDSGELSAASDSSGNYFFTGLAPGNYRVRLVVVPGTLQTTANPAPVAVAPGVPATGVTFGVFTQGVISGNVYIDENGNGVRDTGEAGSSGRTVYFDQNNNNVVGPGEPSVLTDSFGNYSFTGLAPGAYRPKLTGVAGTQLTTDLPGVIDVVSGTSATATHFGVFVQGSISGVVYNDSNGNGVRDTGETVLSNRTVFLDNNDNGTPDGGEPSQMTSASGAFTFSALGPGGYRIRVVVPANTVRTSGLTPTVTMTSGRTSNGHEIALFTLGRISGTIYNDLNGNGTKASGENGLVGRTVFIDTDGDGVLDTGEASTVTGATGVYTFAGLGRGSYVVRLVVPPGQTQTSNDLATINVVSNTVTTTSDIGLYLDSNIKGTVYNDVNGNGMQNSGEAGIAGITVYIDIDLDNALDAGEPSAVTGSTGLYSIGNIKPGSHRVRAVVPSGHVQTSSNPNPLTPPSGGTSANVHFALFTHASISGIVYDDVNGNAVPEVGEPVLVGRTIYLDADGDSVFDLGEVSTVTDSSGGYSFAGLSPGTHRPRLVSSPGWQQTTINPLSIVPTSGLATTGVNFGTFGHATVSGVVFADVDGDGTRDSGETGIAGRTVYLDTNGNGSINPGEPTTTTDSNGNYSFTGLFRGTFKPRISVPGDSTKTSVDPPDVVTTSSAVVPGNDFALFVKATITGTVYNDSNGNGTKDVVDGGVGGRTVYLDLDDDNVFDAGEPNNVTNAAGTFTITNLSPGGYRIRIVLPAGSVTTTPVITPVTPQSGSMNAGYLIGVFATGSISGTVYNDVNGNGVKNSGETGLVRTVYIDGNANNVLDAGEISLVSSATGTYSFSGLLAGGHVVRLVADSSSTRTSTDPATVNVSSGTASVLNDFGVFVHATLGGNVYEDVNGNGSKGTGENGRAGATVYLDTNGNSVRDPGEPFTVTDSSGNYSFTGLLPNSYRIRLDLPQSITQTSSMIATTIPTSGSTSMNNNMGVFVRGIIGGTVFGDTNGNQTLDAGEAGVDNVVVYLDLNGNSQLNAGEPSVHTDPDGDYLLPGLVAGNYRTRLIVPSGVLQTTTSPGPFAVSSGSSYTSTNFGLFTAGTISGTVFLDTDGNGSRNGGEPASAGRVVYLDNDNDGIKDAAEPSFTTNASGSFIFGSLAAGTYRLRVVVPTTMSLTSALPAPVVVVSGTVVTDVDFGIRNSTGATTTTSTTVPVTIAPPTTSPPITPPPPPPTPPGRTDPITVNSGYWMTNTGGNVFAFGDARFYGEAATSRPANPIIGIGPTASGKGYHQVATDGGIFAFGDARFHGSMGGKPLNRPIVGMASTPTGDGYWLVATDGGIFAFGDAKFFGSTGSIRLNQPIVGMTPTASGRGYWLVASDGGIFAFGDAAFYGSTGSLKLNRPIVGMANSGNNGYWLVASDGGLFAFGSARFHGSMGGSPLNRPIVTMRAVGDGSGYWMFASDGGVFAFGSARFRGGTPPTATPIIN